MVSYTHMYIYIHVHRADSHRTCGPHGPQADCMCLRVPVCVLAVWGYLAGGGVRVFCEWIQRPPPLHLPQQAG